MCYDEQVQVYVASPVYDFLWELEEQDCGES